MKTYLLLIRDLAFLLIFIRLLFLETNDLYLILAIIGYIGELPISHKDKIANNVQD